MCDVNYAGSSGFGREYRELLRKQWGVLDVIDCISAAEYLVSQKLVDPDRMIIQGGSSGGYTALAALTFYDTFAAGCSLYGISDLEVCHIAHLDGILVSTMIFLSTDACSRDTQV